MKNKENVLIYFECINGYVFSKLAMNKLDSTTNLKNVTKNILDNLNYADLLNYIEREKIDIIFFISNNTNTAAKIKKNKSIKVILIDLNDFINNPNKY